MASDYRIEFIPLSDIQRWPRNPKMHDEKGMDESLERFGFINPLVMDERTGKLVAGHGRIEALGRRKSASKPPPARVVVQGGEWLVPVVRGIAFKDDAEAESYLLADNRLTEIGGWNEKELSEMLSSITQQSEGLVGTGYSQNDVDALFHELAEAEREVVGKAPQEVLPQFLAAEIKQVVLYFEAPQYDALMSRLEGVQKTMGVASNTEVFVKLLDAWEAANGTAPAAQA